MDIQIYVQGEHFREDSSDLKSAISILDSYENTYFQCLKLSSEKYKIATPLLKSTLRLTELKTSSLWVHIATNAAAAIAPLAPGLFNHAWLLYKSGYDLIGIVTKYFRINDEPMQINIQDSTIEGPVIITPDNGRVVNVNGDVYAAASAMHKGFKRYADMVENHMTDHIKISSQDDDIVFDKHNYQNYKAYTKKHKEDEAVELECNITRFNKKTFKGYLDVYEGEEIFSKPFVANSDMVDDCLNAFRADLVRITAHREVETNALGEASVLRYHATEVTIIE